MAICLFCRFSTGYSCIRENIYIYETLWQSANAINIDYEKKHTRRCAIAIDKKKMRKVLHTRSVICAPHPLVCRYIFRNWLYLFSLVLSLALSWKTRGVHMWANQYIAGAMPFCKVTFFFCTSVRASYVIIIKRRFAC